jgi:hypothetical protein
MPSLFSPAFQRYGSAARPALATSLAACLFACQHGSKSEPAAASSVAATVAASTRPAPAAPASVLIPEVPIGPTLPIQAGVGIGPIRFGATVPTIERLMKAPCDVKNDTLCRYLNQAVEFYLKDGAVERIVIPCHERFTTDAQGNRRKFGYFHGLIPPDLALGMLPAALEEKLGKAPKSETVPEPNETHTARRDSYPGMVLEYDRHANGSLLLCGVTLTKSDVSKSDKK